MRRFACVALTALSAAFCGGAHSAAGDAAEAYPSRPIRIIVGLLAPAETSKAIVDKLEAETARALKLPDVSERISSLGAQPVGGTSREFAAFIASEIGKWEKVIRDAGVKLE